MLSSIKKDKNRRILVKKFEIKRMHAKVLAQDNLLKNYFERNEISFLPSSEAGASFKKNTKAEALKKEQISLYSLLYEKASQRIPRNSSKNRVKNRCIKTGRSHAVLKFCKLSRIALREEASKGLIPGVTKTSW